MHWLKTCLRLLGRAQAQRAVTRRRKSATDRGLLWNPPDGPPPDVSQVGAQRLGDERHRWATDRPRWRRWRSRTDRVGVGSVRWATTENGAPGAPTSPFHRTPPRPPKPQGIDVVTGLMKCGRIHSATATRTAMNPNRVSAMAGRSPAHQEAECGRQSEGEEGVPGRHETVQPEAGRAETVLIHLVERTEPPGGL